MESFVTGFIRASLVWLGIGVLLGIVMAFWPGQTLAWRPAHMHANLLGFVSMMIFGVAYHVLPRFSGRALHRRELAGIHLWVANIGLALLVGGWLVLPAPLPIGRGLLHAGAILSALGTSLFIYNIWRTLGPTRSAIPGCSPLVTLQKERITP